MVANSMLKSLSLAGIMFGPVVLCGLCHGVVCVHPSVINVYMYTSIWHVLSLGDSPWRSIFEMSSYMVYTEWNCVLSICALALAPLCRKPSVCLSGATPLEFCLLVLIMSSPQPESLVLSNIYSKKISRGVLYSLHQRSRQYCTCLSWVDVLPAAVWLWVFCSPSPLIWGFVLFAFLSARLLLSW